MMNAISCAFRGRSDGEWYGSAHSQRLEIGTDVANSITSVAKDSLVIVTYEDRE